MESTLSISSTEEAVQFPKRDQANLAWEDIKQGLQKWRVWVMLAYQDVKLRYRRSILGPFWITLSMAITVYSMGYLYGHLFHSDLKTYFPFLVGGMLAWSLISSSISDLTDGFITSEGLIKQVKLPYTIYIHRIVARNIIIFFHNILVIIPILIIYHDSAKINFNTLMLIPNLILTYINIATYGMIIGMIGSRFRDVSQIIKSLIQVAFFLTPIMWNPSILPEKDQILVSLNPFYAFVELIRAPLIGASLTPSAIWMVSIVTFVGLIISFNMFKKYRSRIIYWL